MFQDPEIPIDIISKIVQEGFFSVYFEAPEEIWRPSKPATCQEFDPELTKFLMEK